MKKLEAIVMLPLVMLGLLTLMAIDLFRVAKRKPTVGEEWHVDYVDGNMNHGQGRKGNEKRH